MMVGVFVLVTASALLGLVGGARFGIRYNYGAHINDSLSPKVVGGEDAAEGEFPYQISLQRVSSDFHYCGGSILSENVVLIAAHCVKGTPPDQFRVVAGFINMKTPGENAQEVTITKIVAHPKFDTEAQVSAYDIAILTVEPAFKWTKYVDKISLPPQGEEFDGTAVATGWGSISSNESVIFPNILQKVNLTILPYDECRKLIGSDVDRDSNICTCSGGVVGVCSGDSGGPLAKEVEGKKYVIGLTSWGYFPCGHLPNVFTKVSNFIDFINENMK